ncbi:hypothetical protein HELRODRAFT_194428 [Helobdella robusta]|uniref:PLAT domain-containing protein n=1 Tax=Helobdella robusta TaxID=6412 RepID=T1FW17_HELRO|nr:hypothetical protein HELRODRAFT_194428 [Helobdella robusta]ESN92055.1 hypothetical protein HELRODRAFT_194428 [Helobdella robusta]
MSYVIVLTITIVCLLYLLYCIASLIFRLSSGPPRNYQYLVIIYSGSSSKALSNKTVKVTLMGTLGVLTPFLIDSRAVRSQTQREILNRNRPDVFLINSERDLSHVNIELLSFEQDELWYVKYVTVIDLMYHKWWYVPCDKWITAMSRRCDQKKFMINSEFSASFWYQNMGICLKEFHMWLAPFTSSLFSTNFLNSTSLLLGLVLLSVTILTSVSIYRSSSTSEKQVGESERWEYPDVSESAIITLIVLLLSFGVATVQLTLRWFSTSTNAFLCRYFHICILTKYPLRLSKRHLNRLNITNNTTTFADDVNNSLRLKSCLKKSEFNSDSDTLPIVSLCSEDEINLTTSRNTVINSSTKYSNPYKSLLFNFNDFNSQLQGDGAGDERNNCRNDDVNDTGDSDYCNNNGTNNNCIDNTDMKGRCNNGNNNDTSILDINDNNNNDSYRKSRNHNDTYNDTNITDKNNNDTNNDTSIIDRIDDVCTPDAKTLLIPMPNPNINLIDDSFRDNISLINKKNSNNNKRINNNNNRRSDYDDDNNNNNNIISGSEFYIDIENSKNDVVETLQNNWKHIWDKNLLQKSSLRHRAKSKNTKFLHKNQESNVNKVSVRRRYRLEGEVIWLVSHVMDGYFSGKLESSANFNVNQGEKLKNLVNLNANYDKKLQILVDLNEIYGKSNDKHGDNSLELRNLFKERLYNLCNRLNNKKDGKICENVGDSKAEITGICVSQEVNVHEMLKNFTYCYENSYQNLSQSQKVLAQYILEKTEENSEYCLRLKCFKFLNKKLNFDKLLKVNEEKLKSICPEFLNLNSLNFSENEMKIFKEKFTKPETFDPSKILYKERCLTLNQTFLDSVADVCFREHFTKFSLKNLKNITSNTPKSLIVDDFYKLSLEKLSSVLVWYVSTCIRSVLDESERLLSENKELNYQKIHDNFATEFFPSLMESCLAILSKCFKDIDKNKFLLESSIYGIYYTNLLLNLAVLRLHVTIEKTNFCVLRAHESDKSDEVDVRNLKFTNFMKKLFKVDDFSIIDPQFLVRLRCLGIDYLFYKDSLGMFSKKPILSSHLGKLTKLDLLKRVFHNVLIVNLLKNGVTISKVIDVSSMSEVIWDLFIKKVKRYVKLFVEVIQRNVAEMGTKQLHKISKELRSNMKNDVFSDQYSYHDRNINLNIINTLEKRNKTYPKMTKTMLNFLTGEIEHTAVKFAVESSALEVADLCELSSQPSPLVELVKGKDENNNRNNNNSNNNNRVNNNNNNNSFEDDSKNTKAYAGGGNWSLKVRVKKFNKNVLRDFMKLKSEIHHHIGSVMMNFSTANNNNKNNNNINKNNNNNNNNKIIPSISDDTNDCNNHDDNDDDDDDDDDDDEDVPNNNNNLMGLTPVPSISNINSKTNGAEKMKCARNLNERTDENVIGDDEDDDDDGGCDDDDDGGGGGGYDDEDGGGGGCDDEDGGGGGCDDEDGGGGGCDDEDGDYGGNDGGYGGNDGGYGGNDDDDEEEEVAGDDATECGSKKNEEEEDDDDEEEEDEKDDNYKDDDESRERIGDEQWRVRDVGKEDFKRELIKTKPQQARSSERSDPDIKIGALKMSNSRLANSKNVSKVRKVHRSGRHHNVESQTIARDVVASNDGDDDGDGNKDRTIQLNDDKQFCINTPSASEMLSMSNAGYKNCTKINSVTSSATTHEHTLASDGNDEEYRRHFECDMTSHVAIKDHKSAQVQQRRNDANINECHVKQITNNMLGGDANTPKNNKTNILKTLGDNSESDKKVCNLWAFEHPTQNFKQVKPNLRTTKSSKYLQDKKDTLENVRIILANEKRRVDFNKMAEEGLFDPVQPVKVHVDTLMPREKLDGSGRSTPSASNPTDHPASDYEARSDRTTTTSADETSDASEVPSEIVPTVATTTEATTDKNQDGRHRHFVDVAAAADEDEDDEDGDENESKHASNEQFSDEKIKTLVKNIDSQMKNFNQYDDDNEDASEAAVANERNMPTASESNVFEKYDLREREAFRCYDSVDNFSVHLGSDTSLSNLRMNVCPTSAAFVALLFIFGVCCGMISISLAVGNQLPEGPSLICLYTILCAIIVQGLVIETIKILVISFYFTAVAKRMAFL